MKPNLLSSLRARLLLIVALTIIPSAAIMFYVAYTQRQEALTGVKEDMAGLAKIAAGDYERVIEGTHQLLQSLSKVPEVLGSDSGACSQLLAGIKTLNPSYLNFGVIELNGAVFCSALPTEPHVNLADREYFRRALATRNFAAGEYQVGRITRKATINFGYPVLDEATAVKRVIFAALDLAWLSKLASQVGLPDGGVLTLVDRHGIILVQYPDKDGSTGQPAEEQALFKTIVKEGAGTIESTESGVTTIHVFTSLRGPPDAGHLYLKLSVPKDILFAGANRTLTLNLASLSLISVFILLAGWYGSDLLVLRPVKALLAATRRVAAGDLSARTGLSRYSGEVGELGRAFDEMASSLEQRTVALEKSNKVKDEFLAVMSHKLRTPLTVVKGYVGMMKDGLYGEISPQQDEALAKVLSRTDEQLNLINGILYATQLESGASSVNHRLVKLPELLASMKASFWSIIGEDVSMRWDYPSDLPPVITDELKLRSVLQNLVENAVKFTEKGTVSVAARHLAEAGLIEFTVSDTGVGIPKDQIDHICEKFYQVDSSDTRLYQGIGLGLYIAKRFTDLLGGTIRVESEAGKGSTFTVVIPDRS